MPAGYVTEPGASVKLKGKTLLVEKNGEILAEWELVHLESLCLWGPVHITHPAMRALLNDGIEVALLSRSGRLIGQLTPPKARNVALRLEQYRCYEDAPRRLVLAKGLVHAKIENARDLLGRYQRNHPEADFSAAVSELDSSMDQALRSEKLDELMGHEGMAAKSYFAAFGRMIRGDLKFDGRSTRPPRDPVNALLSLAYTFLVNELTSLLDAVGFDPYVGFFHALDYGRPSLAVDLAEPFRHGLMDRLVLYLVNNRMLKEEDFERSGSGVMLTRKGFQAFARQYEIHMNRRRVDIPSIRRETYRRHLQLQAERYAAHLQGDEPVIWFDMED